MLKKLLHKMPSISISSFRSLGRSHLLLLISLVACVAPTWTTAIPVATDLPQHLSQIFLLEQTLAGERSDLNVTPWYYPNTLIYAPIFVFWKFSDPITAARLTISALAGAWVLAAYLLAKKRNRPIENWLIGVPLIFNFLFTWGLLNFLIGWPAFCLFISAALAPPSRRQTIAMACCALLLYYAHALWFLMANAWLIAKFIDRQPGSWPFSLIAMLPAWCMACFWYPALASARTTSGAETGGIWETMPYERLDLDYLVNSAQGTLLGGIETSFMLTLIAWFGLVLVTRWRRLEDQVDKPLLLAAITAILAYWVLPWQYMNTIYFNQRWLPFGITLLLLALPAPRASRFVLLFFGVGCVLLFSAASIKAFRNWEAEQLDGFINALSQIERTDRVFGLNMMDGSLYIKGRPGLQLFSYAQAIRGAETNFSFTEHYSGAVQPKSPPKSDPRRKLVFGTFMARQEHLAGFNRILINGDEDIHSYARNRLHLTELNPDQSTWRLYRPLHAEEQSIEMAKRSSQSTLNSR